MNKDNSSIPLFENRPLQRADTRSFTISSQYLTTGEYIGISNFSGTNLSTFNIDTVAVGKVKQEGHMTFVKF